MRLRELRSRMEKWVPVLCSAMLSIWGAGCHHYMQGRAVPQECLRGHMARCSSDRDCGLEQFCLPYTDTQQGGEMACQIPCEDEQGQASDLNCPFPMKCVEGQHGSMIAKCRML